MKESYDFSKAERGKFHRPDAKLNIPVYLDDEVQAYIAGIAEQRHSDIGQVVNDLRRETVGRAAN